MKIGITYNFHADYCAQGFTEEEAITLNPQVTIDAIHNALVQLGHQPVKIGNFAALMACILKNEKWDLIFNIADGTYGYGREALIPSLLDAYQIPYVFSGPLSLAACLDKSFAKRIVRDQGVPTASFSIIYHESDAYNIKLPYPLFIKPLLGGRSLGISEHSFIEESSNLIENSVYLLERYKQPVLVETYLPGREFTIGILGTGNEAKAVGVMEVILTEKAERYGYSRMNKTHCNERIKYKIVEDEEAKKAEKLALTAWRALNCKDVGRIDTRSDLFKQPHFIEANPIPGLHPIHSDLIRMANLKNITYINLISEIIKYYI